MINMYYYSELLSPRILLRKVKMSERLATHNCSNFHQGNLWPFQIAQNLTFCKTMMMPRLAWLLSYFTAVMSIRNTHME